MKRKVAYDPSNSLMREVLERMRWAWARARAAHLTCHHEGDENPYQRFAPGPKWYPRLWEACLLAFEANLIPDEWVERRFYLWRKMQIQPTPQHLAARSLLHPPAGYVEQRLSQERVKLAGYVRLFQRQQTLLRHTTDWGDRDLFHHILSDQTLELGDLFRYCLADRLRVVDVAATYRDRALEEYLSRLSVIERVWDRYIPVLFVHTAERIRNKISSLEIFL